MDGRTCTFFGHSECYGLDEALLSRTVEALICQGVDTFYVGNQGRFDSAVYHCLKQLRKGYPHIRVAVVLAYLPGKKRAGEEMDDTMYPQIEGSPKFAIARRNRWMIGESDYCICYVNHTWGRCISICPSGKAPRFNCDQPWDEYIRGKEI